MNHAKEYLMQIRNLDTKINQRQQEVEALRTHAMSLGTASLDANRVRTDSPDPDPLATRVSKYVDMQKEIDDLIYELIDLKHVIIGQIHELDDSRYMDVLFKRYVELKTFELIAVEMEYEIRQIFRIHGEALQRFNEKFKIKMS